jgi:hypothetical protein
VVGAALVVADPDNTDDGRGEPADGRQERKGNNGLPLAALVGATEHDVVPVKGVAAGTVEELFRPVLVGFNVHMVILRRTTHVHNQTKGHEPADGNENVDGPVDEAA